MFLKQITNYAKYLAVLDLRNNPGGVFEEAIAMAVRSLPLDDILGFYVLFQGSR
jgi:C-terminal processing protease CtpA/Prc